MKKLTVLILAIAITMVCCEKEIDDEPNLNNDVNEFTDLNVPINFSWQTTKNVTIKVEGISNASGIKKKIEVKSIDEDVIFSRMIIINESTELKFIVPSYLNEVVVMCGTISKKLDITEGNSTFTFLQTDDRSDLDEFDK